MENQIIVYIDGKYVIMDEAGIMEEIMSQYSGKGPLPSKQEYEAIRESFHVLNGTLSYDLDKFGGVHFEPYKPKKITDDMSPVIIFHKDTYAYLYDGAEAGSPMKEDDWKWNGSYYETDDYMKVCFGATSMRQLTVSPYSGISGDGFTVAVTELVSLNPNLSKKTIFTKKYAYGYDASYDKAFADDRKPYVSDIIMKLVEEYDVNAIDVVAGDNTYQGTKVSEKDVTDFVHEYIEDTECESLLLTDSLEDAFNKASRRYEHELWLCEA